MKRPSFAQSDWLERLVRWGVYLLMCTPLVFSPRLLFPHSSTKGYVIFALVELVALGALWLLVKRPERRWRWDATSVTLTVFVGILVLASLFGVDPSFSFWASVDRITGGFMWMHLLALYLVVRTVFVTKEDWERLLTVSVAVALVSAVVHVLDILDVANIVGASGGSTLGNTSFYGAYLLFQIFFAAWLWRVGSTKRRRVYGGMAALVLIGILLTLGANAATISLAGGAILALGIWLWGSSRDEVSRAGQALTITLALVFFLTVALAFTPGSALQQTFTGLSTSSRFIVWDMAWEAMKDRPLLGWGLENFQYVSLEYYNPCLGSQRCGHEMWYDRAHNKLLDVGVEAGFLGLFSYLAVFFVAIRALLRRVTSRSKREMAALGVGLLAAYAVQNLTVLDVAITMMFWVLTLAWISSLTSSVDTTPSAKRSTWVLPSAVLASLLLPITLTTLVIEPVRANAALIASSYGMSFDERLENLPRAMHGSPQGEDLRRVYAANETGRMLWSTSLEVLSGMESQVMSEVDQQVEALFATMDASPNYLRAPLAIAILEQGRGRYFDPQYYQVAEQVLVEAVARNPVHPEPYWALASLYLETGKTTEALELLEQVRMFAPELPMSYYNYVVGAVFLQDEEVLRQAATEAIDTYPALLEKVSVLLQADLSERRIYFLYGLHL